MKKSIKVGSKSFLHLDGNTLYFDNEDKSEIYSNPYLMKDTVLDFDINEKGLLRIFTKDGNALTINFNNNEIIKDIKIVKKIYNASIFKKQILIIYDQTFTSSLIDFNGKIIEEYSDIKKQVRFCVFTSQLKALADSSLLYVKKIGENNWKRYKYREFYITHLINVNRHSEFGLTTQQNTRIFRKHFQTVFRSWAKNTVSLLQCPCRKHFYAHLDNEGLLRIGDNEGQYSIQENNITGICWDMGMLWGRNNNNIWKKISMTFDDQLFDLRSSKIEGLEAPLLINEQLKVIDVVETIIERPSLSQDIMKTLPSVAQQLKNGIIVKEALHSLETYINKIGSIEEMIGQLDLILPE